MDSGVRAGVRVKIDQENVTTMVKDSDDVSYRECAAQAKINQQWANEYYFAVAAKNTLDDKGVMQMTDLDLNSIEIQTLRPWEMYTPAEAEEEKNSFLLKLHGK